jgi:heme-degrading monooxygenase HmoA
VPVITLFEAARQGPALEAAWRASRAPGLLLRARSDQAEFSHVEVVPDDRGPAEDLPGDRCHSARYERSVDDLADDRLGGCVLVNAFEVPEGDDAEFVALWTATRDTVRPLDGYIGSRLHRAVDAAAEFRFVNVAPWRDVDAFTAAVASLPFLRASREIYHRAHPSLFDVLVAG